MDLFTDGQIMALGFIAILAVLAYKFKQPSLSLVAGAGLFILAMQIYDPAAPDLLLIGMMILTAIAQFVLVVSVSSRRR